MTDLDIWRTEVVALHDFISVWIRGGIARSDERFRIEFVEKLHQDFLNVQPAGRVLARGELLSAIEQSYGTNSDFRIEIADFRLRGERRGIVWATYVEKQFGARQSVPPDNDRLSSVVFERADDGRPLWCHLHETAL